MKIRRSALCKQSGPGMPMRVYAPIRQWEQSLNPTATDDNCGIASVTNDFNGLSTLAGAVFPAGLTTVIWT
jgi:hypothetical protein